MKKLILGLVFIVIIAASLLTFNNWQQSQNEQKFSNKDFISTITSKHPAFLDANKPVIEIYGVKKLEDGWYVVTIKSVNEEKMAVPVYVVLKDNSIAKRSSNLNLVLGPEARFTESQMLNNNVPDSVILELNKS